MGLFRTIRLAFYAIFFILIAGGYYVYIQALDKPLENRDKALIIPKGVGVSWLARHLEKEQIINNRYVFRVYSWINYKNNKIKAGEYTLVDVNTIPALIHKVHKGEVKQYIVTLIEGWTFKQFKAYLSKQKQLEHKITTMRDAEIMRELGLSGVHPEGQFAPETYFFQKGDSDLDILKQAHERLKKLLDKAWQQRDRHSMLNSKYELLTLASIVEKETGQSSERATISGVFHNRLRLGMKLQTDPTVIYGMGEQFDGNIRRSDLRGDTPYNTYRRYGLPPTPIAMVGFESLIAAAKPESTKYLYFVGKGNGSHYFSSTLKQHNQAVRKYQLKQ